MKEQTGAVRGGLDRRRFFQSAGGAALGALATRLLGAQDLAAREVSDALEGEVLSRLANAYTLEPEVTYLNHASIGTIPRSVQKAHQRYLEICETNPWLYMWGGPWKEPLEEARRQVAELLGATSDEVALTHNTTEAFNLLSLGWPLGKGDEVLFSSLNHDGASTCWFHQASVRGFRVRRFDFPHEGVRALTAEELLDIYDRQINKMTRVLVFPHVDNHLGVRHPIRRLAALARSKGVRFVAVDAAQTVGMLPFAASALGVDVLAASGHKWLQAPKGLGVLYVRRESLEDLRPMWVTWDLEPYRGSARLFEVYGTRNLPAALALGDAARFQQRISIQSRKRHLRRLRHHARQRVATSRKLTWESPGAWEVGASLFAVGLKGVGAGATAARLFQKHGVVVRPFEEEHLNALRVSPNALNSLQDLDRFFDLL